MNKYQSLTRFLRARNIVEKVISPPTDLSIAAADWVTQIFSPYDFDMSVANVYKKPWNVNSSLLLRSYGIYSNLADGLVFKDPGKRLDIQIYNGAFSRGAAITGIQFTAGSKAITSATIDLTTVLSVDDFIVSNANRYYRIATIAVGGASATITDYARATSAGAPPHETIYPLVPDSLSTQYIAIHDISQLNVPFMCEQYLNPLTYASNIATDVLLWVVPSIGIDAAQASVFITKSIDTAFDTETIYLDAGIEIDFTHS
jgi:hypothetical protein